MSKVIKKQVEQIMQQKVTRKEFLVRAGLAIITLSGVVGALKSSGQFMQHGTTAKSKGSPYGNSKYGA